MFWKSFVKQKNMFCFIILYFTIQQNSIWNRRECHVYTPRNHECILLTNLSRKYRFLVVKSRGQYTDLYNESGLIWRYLTNRKTKLSIWWMHFRSIMFEKKYLLILSLFLGLLSSNQIENVMETSDERNVVVIYQKGDSCSVHINNPQESPSWYFELK